MASSAESDCLSNPNFAVICSFLDRYGEKLALSVISYKDLQEWIEDTTIVHPILVDLHCKLLRRIHKKLSSVSAERWERGLVKFLSRYGSAVDAWEIERFGYKLTKTSTKLSLLKNLMESQFDCNNKFKEKLNELTADEMRFQPIGRDKHGLAYWYFLDKDLNLRVYREDQDDVDSESWELVCSTRDDLARLISHLQDGTEFKPTKHDTSDFSDSSVKSEPTSDNNEDSRDSFKQRTPHGPSPLSVKQEPGDTDSADAKPPIILKLSRSDNQSPSKASKSEAESPSKMLQKKFKKEKATELKKIICKLKQDDIVTDESDDEDKAKDQTEDIKLLDEQSGCSVDKESESLKDKLEAQEGEPDMAKKPETEIDKVFCKTKTEPSASEDKVEGDGDKTLLGAKADGVVEKDESVDRTDVSVTQDQSLEASKAATQGASTASDITISEDKNKTEDEHNNKMDEVDGLTDLKAGKSPDEIVPVKSDQKSDIKSPDKEMDEEKSKTSNNAGIDIENCEQKGGDTSKALAPTEESENATDISAETSKKSVKDTDDAHGKCDETDKAVVKEDNDQLESQKDQNEVESDTNNGKGGPTEVGITDSKGSSKEIGSESAEVMKDDSIKASMEKEASESKDEHMTGDLNVKGTDKDSEQSNENLTEIDSKEVSMQNEMHAENTANITMVKSESVDDSKSKDKELTTDDEKPVATNKNDSSKEERDECSENDASKSEQGESVATVNSESSDTDKPTCVENSVCNIDKDEVELKDNGANSDDNTENTKLTEEISLGSDSSKSDKIEVKTNNEANSKSDSSLETRTSENETEKDNCRDINKSHINITKETDDGNLKEETASMGEKNVEAPKSAPPAESEALACKDEEIVKEKSENLKDKMPISPSSPVQKSRKRKQTDMAQDQQNSSTDDDEDHECKNIENRVIKTAVRKGTSSNPSSPMSVENSVETIEEGSDKTEAKRKDVAKNDSDECKDQLEKRKKVDISELKETSGKSEDDLDNKTELENKESGEHEKANDSSIAAADKAEHECKDVGSEIKKEVKADDNTDRIDSQLIEDSADKIDSTEIKGEGPEKENNKAANDCEKASDKNVNDEFQDYKEKPAISGHESGSGAKNEDDKVDAIDSKNDNDYDDDNNGDDDNNCDDVDDENTEIEDNVPTEDAIKYADIHSDTTEDNMPLSKVTKRSKSQAKKRQAEDNLDIEPVEPASKRSKLRGRVTSRGRGKRQTASSAPVKDDSSTSDSDSDDLPLSQVASRGGAGKGRGSHSRGRNSVVGRQRGKAVNQKAKEKPPPPKPVEQELVANASEDECGRRRSARVRNMRVRKKSPSPEYLPSASEEDEVLLGDEEDEEFMLKSSKRKKREPREVIEEVPKGKNALRLEAKNKKTKGKKIIQEEEEEEEAFPCVKCGKTHQPEWILLCDKCDAGFHTACLRPPLMIIPDGDWFCPPCEHAQLKEKLEEQLKSLDQAIVKNDRLTKRQERLAFVSVSLDNVLKESNPGRPPGRAARPKKPLYYSDDDDSLLGSASAIDSGSATDNSNSSSGGESGTDSTSARESASSGEASDARPHRTRESTLRSSRRQRRGHKKHHKHKKHKEPHFTQRSCRTKTSVSYRFEEYDELIKDAIEEDLSIPKEPKPKKVKPPGISRGKDMSNILGISDEESTKKRPKKRKPRLTELDDEDDDDDTDDYKVSEASASEASGSTESYDSSEAVTDDSVGSAWRQRASRSSGRRGSGAARRKGRQGRGRSTKYQKDFVVDSDFESDEDYKRRSRRTASRKKSVSYREINSDETEIEDDEDSFHTSDLDDSDFEANQKKKKQLKQKGQDVKNRPRSGKRQRIQQVTSSEEEGSTEESDGSDSSPRRKSAKKLSSKSARYDDSEEDSDENTPKKGKGKPKKKAQLESNSESEGSEDESGSSTEDSSEDDTPKKKKPTVVIKGLKAQARKKKVIQSDSEETNVEDEKGDVNGKNELGEEDKDSKKVVEEVVKGEEHEGIRGIKSGGNEAEGKGKGEPLAATHSLDSDHTEQSEESEHDSGEWEEIAVETEEKTEEDKDNKSEIPVDQNEEKLTEEKVEPVPAGVGIKSPKGKRSKALVENTVEKKGGAKKKRVDSTGGSEHENVVVEKTGADMGAGESTVENVGQEIKPEEKEYGAAAEANVDKVEKATPKKRGRKPRNESQDSENTTPEITPKKRGRKPKAAKVEAEETGQETQGEEIPVKKKRGRKAKSDLSSPTQTAESAGASKIVNSKDNKDYSEGLIIKTDQSETEKGEERISPNPVKNDSPLSARKTQNAPVGVVKPEVRQGVIVENKNVTESRTIDPPPMEGALNPLQGMRNLAMGSQGMQGQGDPSGFTPYNQSNYPQGNIPPPPYMGQQGFHGYPPGPHGPQYGPGTQGPRGPYQGPPGMPPGPHQQGPHPQGAPPHSQYPPGQGPMSPNSYQQSNSFMSQMQSPGHPPAGGYYPPGFRPPQMGPMTGSPETFSGAQGASNQPRPPTSAGGHPPQYPQGPFPHGYYPQQGPYGGPRPGYPLGHGQYPMGATGSQQGRMGPQGGPYPHQGMPYNYPPSQPPLSQHSMPFGPGAQQPGIASQRHSSAAQPIKPQAHLAVSTSGPMGPQGSAPSPRNESEAPNRGFMMDNILKPSPDVGIAEEDGEDVSDIDRYTSFLCKDK